MRRYIVAMSGASGAPYALSVMGELLRQGHEVHVIVTEAAWRVLLEEHDWEVVKREQNFVERFGHLSGKLVYHPIRDIGASIASGSFQVDGMVVVPCTMGTLAKIASGISSNLLERAADVMIKERYPLILVPRETPLSPIHLENMLKLSRLGVQIVPPMPGFYHRPSNLDEMVRFVSGKILDQLRVAHQLYKRWEGGK
ncbi:4-hydroxy-3-polyprenylbenzoate decarboxylase [Thermoactinomyces sp. DSM 45891]|uniref:UbiX family flavin prenyltransferase n=1 Tax=Thermoactinomyces sp. DSM 45891 TaxID=1761907 RepID=UPI0009227F69|nr:flavin prenyltransferase UbiX [Thermoactinomyces sp. DSM 45891]SFX00818.1 4-hydroxy-3-polyprenylbenzoate decarboxylase [Thermoactinomyces sp. DSM 45891]